MAKISPIRVMTSNIRNSGAKDGAHAWPKRRQLWIGIVRSFDPDLLGVQEVLSDQYSDLKSAFPDYTLAGVAREDGDQVGERSLILFRTKRFTQLDRSDFWFSSTPDRPGGLLADAACTRLCSWVRLQDRQTGKNVKFFNLHLDHEGTQARVQSAGILTDRLGKDAPADAVIVTGDFNCTEQDEPYRILTRQAALVDSYRCCHPIVQPDEASFHSFSASTNGLRIDWILHNSLLRSVAAVIDRTRGPHGEFASDHDAVTAVLE